MQRSTFLFIAALIVNGGRVQAQGLLQTITAPEQAVPVVNQTRANLPASYRFRN